MYIPLFIAIWLGLVCSANAPTTTSSPNQGVYINTSTGAPEDPGVPTDSIPGDGTGGETGSNPPR